jgi:hypothetical protein
MAKYAVIKPFVSVDPVSGTRAFSTGDVFTGTDAAVKDYLSAGFIVGVGQPAPTGGAEVKGKVEPSAKVIHKVQGEVK